MPKGYGDLTVQLNCWLFDVNLHHLSINYVNMNKTYKSNIDVYKCEY